LAGRYAELYETQFAPAAEAARQGTLEAEVAAAAAVPAVPQLGAVTEVAVVPEVTEEASPGLAPVQQVLTEEAATAEPELSK
jgi:hypothetical protein